MSDPAPQVPVFHFSLKDAANPATAKSFVAVCLQTKRFARNEKGSIVWAPSPGEWIPIARAAEFRTICEDADVLRVTGDTNGDAFFALWMYLADRRWMLPRIGGAWNPDKPLPVRNAGQVRS